MDGRRIGRIVNDLSVHMSITVVSSEEGRKGKSGNDGKPSNSKKTIRKNKMESWKWCKNSNDRKAAK